MAYYPISLKAGIEHVQDVLGSIILIDSVNGAAGVDVTPVLNGSRQPTMPGRKPGFKYQVKYDQVILAAAADCTVSIFLTNNEVSLGFTDGAQVNVAGGVAILNGLDQRVPVDLAGGTVTVNAANVGISNTDANPVPVRSALLTTLVAKNSVAIGIGAAQVLVNDAAARGLYIRNASADAVLALGGADVTLANAAILLQPGESIYEDRAPGAGWYATSDKAGTDARVMVYK